MLAQVVRATGHRHVSMADGVAVGVLCIAVAGIAAQWLAWRLRVPAIVLLFAFGLLVGPGLEILRPAASFGGAIRPMIGLAVAIVVFEGGLSLNFRELRSAGEGVLRLTAVALPISFVLAAIAARFAAGMDWDAALLFGAITVVTGPTVVLPLLRNTRLEPRAASFLKWEAIVNDPVGALLAAIVLAIMLSHGPAAHGRLAAELALGLPLAVVLGVGAGFFVRWAFNHDHAPDVLRTPILLALALGVYAVGNLAMDEAGLAAATIFGVTLANLRIPGLSELARFKEALVVLLVSALFITLTASLDRSLLGELSWPVLLLTAAMVFAVRPAAILLATWRSNLHWKERLLSAWIAPRGIVAAAVAGVASTQLASNGDRGAALIMPSVFALIAATVVLHGFSLGPLARRLGLTLGDKPVLAIVGANAWTTDLAATLDEAGIAVLLIDIFPGALQPARARNIPVLQVEVLSEHGEHSLARQRVDYLLAATPDDVYNSLVNTRLAPELGRNRVFQLAPSGSEHDDWVGHSRDWRGQVFGVPALPAALFRQRHKQGWRFAFIDPPEAEADTGETVTLSIIRPNGHLIVLSTEAAAVQPASGDKLLVFAPP
jgi:NhaP-type Na+/H+ or K+/H+ antiporter